MSALCRGCCAHSSGTLRSSIDLHGAIVEHLRAIQTHTSSTRSSQPAPGFSQLRLGKGTLPKAVPRHISTFRGSRDTHGAREGRAVEALDTHAPSKSVAPVACPPGDGSRPRGASGRKLEWQGRAPSSIQPGQTTGDGRFQNIPGIYQNMKPPSVGATYLLPTSDVSGCQDPRTSPRPLSVRALTVSLVSPIPGSSLTSVR